mmetsp:Transcript_24868/g.44931  ORF Transcript_24868/g.44931 Transcript_24868/m.44931 type:complete len:214 (+) Transcript_24868:294-935(+)
MNTQLDDPPENSKHILGPNTRAPQLGCGTVDNVSSVCKVLSQTVLSSFPNVIRESSTCFTTSLLLKSSLFPSLRSLSISPSIQSIVFLRPSWILMEGSHCNFSRMSLLFELRPLTPIGPSMCLRGMSSLPLYVSAILANSFIDTISVDPRLMGTSQSEKVNRRTPSTQSSINVKERVCFPSPQISNSLSEVTAFRQKAAGAFSRPPFHVPLGP